MSSTGAGYDYSCGTFSPDGRIFQVEYAQKAVETSGTAIGIRCTDGIVMAVEKPMLSKMLVTGSNRRAFGIDIHAGIVLTGFPADGRQIVNRAREEASSFQSTFGHKIVPSVLANRIALFVHYYTTHGSLRPFGSTALLAAYDEDMQNHELYMIEPSGSCFRYFGCAAGKGANGAKTELEKLFSRAGEQGISCEQAVRELAKIFYIIRDPTKDKPFELEMSWLCASTNWQYVAVPASLVAEADANGCQMTGSGNYQSPPPETDAGMDTSSGPIVEEEGPVHDMDTS
jgi:20S proteasome subunit alpha 7